MSDDLTTVLGVLDSGSPVSVADAAVIRWLGIDVDATEPLPWELDLGARKRWRLPFAVLLGQRGWFDQFPTRIDARTSVVELPDL